MEQDRFGDSRATPWCKEDAGDMSSQRAFFTRIKHCVDMPQFARRSKTTAGGFGSVPPSSKGAGVPALLRIHHWTTFPPSSLVEKVDLGVR